MSRAPTVLRDLLHAQVFFVRTVEPASLSPGRGVAGSRKLIVELPCVVLEIV